MIRLLLSGLLLALSSVIHLQAQNQEPVIPQPPLPLVVITTVEEQGEAEQLVKVAGMRDQAALKAEFAKFQYVFVEREGIFYAFSPLVSKNIAEAELDLLWRLWQKQGKIDLSDFPAARSWCQQAIEGVYKGSLDYVENRLQMPKDEWLNHCPVSLSLKAKMSASCKIPGVAGAPKMFLEDIEVHLDPQKILPELAPQTGTDSSHAFPRTTKVHYMTLFSTTIPNRDRAKKAMLAFGIMKERQEKAEAKWRSVMESLIRTIMEQRALSSGVLRYDQLNPAQQKQLRDRLSTMDSLFKSLKEQLPRDQQLNNMEVQFGVTPVIEMQFQCSDGPWSYTVAIGDNASMELRMKWFVLPKNP